jgi:hypothetical protein
MRQCQHGPSKWVGIVVNESQVVALDSTKPHASRSTCGRPDCIKAAKQWVAATANERAVFLTYGEIRARKQAQR